MIYPKNCSPKLEEALFKNPTAEYRGIPFWSWNCEITKELIDSQLECFKLMGFGGVDIHPRTGLDTAYLGDEYMKLIRYAIEQCKEKGLFCWLYDEDRFSSGVAGGKVTENFRLRGRHLLLTERKKAPYQLSGYCDSREAFEAAVDAGEKPRGYYVTAYFLKIENGNLSEYGRSESEEEIRTALQKGNKVRYAYVEMEKEKSWYENQTYSDTMNPQAVAEFIRLTHDTYAKAAGEEFGRVIPAIFTDEPYLGKHSLPASAESEAEITLPFTDYLEEYVHKIYGIELLDIVPEYIWETPDGNGLVNRYRYRKAASECFIEAFMDQIGEWCSEHGIAMTGHVLGEEHLSSQAGTVGDCMHCYRPMALPGVDILCDFREYTTVKQASSVARQNGKEGTVSELYGVTQWDCDFKTYKLQGDWQAALGITVRIPHLSHMSLKGEAKRDWPASIFYQSPWYQEFPYIEDYFARINTALTRGNAVVKVGVLHPVESMWLKLGPNEQTADICEQMEQDFQNLTEWLLYGTIDFDFLSEALLPMQCQTGANDRNSLLKVGCMSYSAVVIPEIATIRSSTLDILESFVDRGGRLIIMGRIPSLVDAKRSDRVKALAGRCVRITKGRSELYAAISEERVLDIRKEDGSRSDNLFYQMRQDGENNWLFICHVNRNDSHVSAAEKYVVKIRGSFDLTFYDAMTGEIRPFPSRQKKNFTIFDWETYHEDSILLRLEKKPEQPEVWGEHQRKHELTAVFTLEAPDSYRCLEPNVLLLDYARFRIDGGEVEKREEILRLDNRIRERLGFVLRGGEMNQPWFLQEKETHKVTLYYEIHSLIESPVNLAMEDVESCKAFLNGEPVCMKAEGYYVDPAIQVIKLPAIRPGKNQLALEVVYNQKSGLENIYLLGDFDVELNGTEAILKGRRKRLLPGDITRQGMPFYTGNLEYTYTFHVPDGESNCELHIPHIHAPALAVFLDGRKKGLIAYAPHCLALGKLSQGEHKLTILLYGNRFNAFGTLHNADKNFVWYGPDSYRTHGDAWTDCYMVRPVGMDAPEIMLVH